MATVDPLAPPPIPSVESSDPGVNLGETKIDGRDDDPHSKRLEFGDSQENCLRPTLNDCPDDSSANAPNLHRTSPRSKQVDHNNEYDIDRSKGGGGLDNTNESKLGRHGDEGLRNIALSVRSSDMTQEMQQQAIQICVEAASQFTSGSKIASAIKRQFDSAYPEVKWHCLTGKAFGCFVTYDPGCFIHLAVDKDEVILFRAS